MTAARRILGIAWALYGITAFFLLVLLLFPFYLVFLGLLPRSTYRLVIRFNHHVFPWLFFPLVGIRLKVHGKEKLQRGQTYLIISNHRTAIDFLANPMAFPGLYKYLAKKELTKVPLLGFLVKRLCVLVDRKNPSSAAKSMQWLKRTLGEGYSVFIYPEGTRNRTGEPLGRFYGGAFRLATELNVPVAVMTLQNVHERSATARSFDLWPGTLHIRWSAVLQPSEFDSAGSLEAACREAMLADLWA